MTDTKFKKGVSGNPNGRPPGKSKFTTLKESFFEAFEKLDSTQGLVNWIKEDSENQRFFYSWLSKMLPREISATVTIQIEKYGFLPAQPIPDEVLRDYLVELVIAQVLHSEIKKKIISRIKGELTPKLLNFDTLKQAYKTYSQSGGYKKTREDMSGPSLVLPVKSQEVKSTETVRRKPKPKTVDPRIEAKKKQIRDLEKELNEKVN